MNKIAIIISASHEYEDVWNLTYPKTSEYCQKHGYELIRVEGGKKPLVWERLSVASDLMDLQPELEWVFCRGVDFLVMNPEIKLEEFIDDNYDFIITRDCHDLNSDAVLIKNSDFSKQYLNYLYTEGYEKFKNDCWTEQRAIIDSYQREPWKSKIKVIPQKSLNSYHYPYYHRTESEDGQYTEGDLHLHFPGMDLKTRIESMKTWNQS